MDFNWFTRRDRKFDYIIFTLNPLKMAALCKVCNIKLSYYNVDLPEDDMDRFVMVQTN